jgi:arsenite methyltransferase
METTLPLKKVNTDDLQLKVRNMYREVALHPQGEYHFEMGRGLAEKLGYETKDLDAIPQQSLESFAGVGYFHDLADIKPGDRVLDLGSGSGTDSFIAAVYSGVEGSVTGIDMTDEQLQKSERLAREYKFLNLHFVKGYIESLPFADATFDVVISNGVINLSASKSKIFSEVSRVLRAGGRMAISDIVTEKPLPEKITCDSTLWASCIGGAEQEDAYRLGIQQAGMEVTLMRNNDTYQFISIAALGATKKYGVKSISLLAIKK